MKTPESLQQAAHDFLADAESAADKLRQDLARVFPARQRTLLLALASIFFLHNTTLAGGFKSLAKELSRAARDSGIVRVAVIGFEPADSSSLKDGRAIAEKLTTQLVRTGRVQTVERALIGKLLEEHNLAKSGLLDHRTLKKLGAVLSLDGIVSGSFVTLGSKVLVNARLINVETGLIIAACEKEAPREWFEELGLVHVPAPEMTVDAPTDFMANVPRIFPEDDGIFRDSVGDQDCARASERVDRLEGMILEIKARYWALRLKNGLSLQSLTVNPGSTITDPKVKKRFYDRMKSWYAQDTVPELTPAEVRRFVAIDQKAFTLYQACGI